MLELKTKNKPVFLNFTAGLAMAFRITSLREDVVATKSVHFEHLQLLVN